ncbi:YHYH domain-containing protein [Paenochrobactrum glaciei]
MRTFIIGLFILSVGATAAMASSGRTDKNGCHTERKTGIYHCH